VGLHQHRGTVPSSSWNPAASVCARNTKYAPASAAFSSPAESWWLHVDEARLQAIEQAVTAYTGAPSPGTAAAAQAAIKCDEHAFKLNARMSDMFARAPASGMDSEIVKEHKRLASQTSVVSFSHERMENTDFLMETVNHNFRMTPSEGDSVLFECTWTLSRNKVPGLSRQEHSTTIIANETRILRASEVDSSISHQAMSAIQEHLGSDHIHPKDFCWFLSFLATFPSDDAFDVVSASMPKGKFVAETA